MKEVTKIKSSKKKVSIQDEETFDIIFNELYVPLVVFATRYLNHHEEVAEDLVQDAFVNLFQKKVVFNKKIALKGYLFQSVKNACLNYKKRHSKLQHLIQEGKTSNQMEDASLVEKMYQEEEYHKLKKSINQLPTRCKEIFQLSLRGVNNEDIAKQLGISKETVKSHKKRGKKLLAKSLLVNPSLLKS